MSFSVGIVGLPNVGKSTLFKTLTKKQVDIAPYPFTTINPNVGVVAVPDERLEKIAQMVRPEKITPTIIEFVDIAGLVRGAHKGEGLGNQFLAKIRECNAILEIVRGFADEKVENVLGEINPEKEMATVRTELLMKDLETLENIIKTLETKAKTKEKTILKKLSLCQKIKKEVGQGKLISEIDLEEKEKEDIEEYQFLTAKPILCVLNVEDRAPHAVLPIPFLAIDLKTEEEMIELSEKDRRELGFQSQIDQIISACYNILDLITFYTIAGGKETRAWTLKKGEKIIMAASKVHSDFAQNFIKGEIANWQKLLSVHSWKEARERGLVKEVGKDYLVQDGDVIEFKI